jgi:transposase
LLGAWPELGQLPHQQIAALAGVAPFARDSGTWRGQRHVRGGRAPVRRAVYMAALGATRHHPIIKDFYQRLLAGGTPKKVALTACLRTLLTILNAMVRSNTVWRRTTAQTA